MSSGQYAWNGERWHDRLNDPDGKASIEETRADCETYFSEPLSEGIIGGPWCGCINLEAVADAARAYLEGDNRGGAYDAVVKAHGALAANMLVEHLNALGLAEHGGNAIYSWVTDAGRAWCEIRDMDTRETATPTT